MARLARVVVPGYPHHITQRGNRRQQTFFCDEDYKEYIDLMSQWCSQLGVAIWFYCLMPNHGEEKGTFTFLNWLYSSSTSRFSHAQYIYIHPICRDGLSCPEFFSSNLPRLAKHGERALARRESKIQPAATGLPRREFKTQNFILHHRSRT